MRLFKEGSCQLQKNRLRGISGGSLSVIIIVDSE